MRLRYLLAIPILALAAGCSKPKPSIKVIPSQIPDGPHSKDFYTDDPDKPCVIIIPPGRSLTLFDKVTINPAHDGPLNDPPPYTTVYGCNFKLESKP